MSCLIKFDSRRLPRHASFGAALLDHTPADWGQPYVSDRDRATSPDWAAIDASLATDAELEPLPADDDVVAGEPSPLTSRPGDRDACDQLWSLAFDLFKAGEDPRMPGGLGREKIKAWAYGEVAGKDARWSLFYDRGMDAGLDAERDTPCPATDFEARHGWNAGQQEASKRIAARHADELREMARGR